MLYRGEFVWSTDLPWHYILTWMGITTPLLYGVCLLLALYNCFHYFRTRGFSLRSLDPKWGFVGLWAVFPILLVSFGGAHLYDGWRHLFFVAPEFVALCTAGIPSRLRPIWSLSLCVGVVACAMVSMFP